MVDEVPLDQLIGSEDDDKQMGHNEDDDDSFPDPDQLVGLGEDGFPVLQEQPDQNKQLEIGQAALSDQNIQQIDINQAVPMEQNLPDENAVQQAMMVDEVQQPAPNLQNNNIHIGMALIRMEELNLSRLEQRMQKQQDCGQNISQVQIPHFKFKYQETGPISLQYIC